MGTWSSVTIIHAETKDDELLSNSSGSNLYWDCSESREFYFFRKTVQLSIVSLWNLCLHQRDVRMESYEPCIPTKWHTERVKVSEYLGRKSNISDIPDHVVIVNLTRAGHALNIILNIWERTTANVL